MKTLILLLALSSSAFAAGNAPDVHGRFVLVASSTVHKLNGDTCYSLGEPQFCFVLEQQPLVVIPGFDSFYRCRGAGMELQARMRSNGYTIDFSCLLQGS